MVIPDESSPHSHNQLSLSLFDSAAHGKMKSTSDDKSDFGTSATCFTTENHANSLFIDPRLLIALRSPVLYENLFEKYKPLLNMCKYYASLF